MNDLGLIYSTSETCIILEILMTSLILMPHNHTHEITLITNDTTRIIQSGRNCKLDTTAES